MPSSSLIVVSVAVLDAACNCCAAKASISSAQAAVVMAGTGTVLATNVIWNAARWIQLRRVELASSTFADDTTGSDSVVARFVRMNEADCGIQARTTTTKHKRSTPMYKVIRPYHLRPHTPPKDTMPRPLPALRRVMVSIASSSRSQIRGTSASSHYLDMSHVNSGLKTDSNPCGFTRFDPTLTIMVSLTCDCYFPSL
jgi:hypothetical protein